MLKNNARKWANFSIFITIAGLIMIIAGITIDDYDYYWMIFVGLILFLTFLICFLIFSSQARHLEKMFRGENILAEWSFDQSNQLLKAEEQYLKSKQRNKILLGIVAFFFVVISALFAVFGFDSFEDAAGFLGIMLAVLLLISLVALTAPGFAFRRMQKAPPLVFISREGAWVMGEFAKWKGAMSSTHYVEYILDRRKAVIIVHFSIFQRYGFQRHECRIPVPDGRADEAQMVAAEIARYCNAELVISDRTTQEGGIQR